MTRSRTTTPFRRASVRLARAPDIFGDFFWSGSIAMQTNVPFFGPGFVTADVPLGGGTRRSKVAEQNRALPSDRAYFTYHHFHNALQYALAPAPNAPPTFENSLSVDRYTFGLERTFCEGTWSAEIRLPLSDRVILSGNSPAIPAPTLQVEGGSVGDLTVIAKRLVYSDEALVVSTGLGLNAPTGSDVRSRQPGPGEEFTLASEAVHFLPFLGLMAAPSERFFWHGFLQLDVASQGNRLDVNDPFGPTRMYRVNDQTLLHLDLSAGYWLFEDPCSCDLIGLAGLLELHYTTALQDADVVPLSAGFGALGNLDNRFDLVNLTAGLHAAFRGGTELRVGAVLPLGDENERFFDAEVQAALIRRF